MCKSLIVFYGNWNWASRPIGTDMTVCIVDDNALVNSQLKLLLAQAGLTDTLASTDTRQALVWFMASPRELLWLTYNMP